MEDPCTTISLRKQMRQRYAVACVSSIWGDGNEVDGAYSVVYDWFWIDTSCHMNGVARMAFRSIRSIRLEMDIVGNAYGAWQYPPSRSWAHEAMKESMPISGEGNEVTAVKGKARHLRTWTFSWPMLGEEKIRKNAETQVSADESVWRVLTTIA